MLEKMAREMNLNIDEAYKKHTKEKYGKKKKKTRPVTVPALW